MSIPIFKGYVSIKKKSAPNGNFNLKFQLYVLSRLKWSSQLHRTVLAAARLVI